MNAESSPAEPAASSGGSRAVAIFGMLLCFVGGYVLGVYRSGPGDKAFKEAAEAKRVEVPVAMSPAEGPEDALVTIVEFADFQCGFCARTGGLHKRLLADFPGTVRWVFKQFPLDFHTDARPAARASLAAHAQGRFWPYHDRLFAMQGRMGASELIGLASELGLDKVRFRTELDGKVIDKLVGDDLELGKKVGVSGTPTFFINGRLVEGAMAYSDLERLVRQELGWAAEMLRRGVPRAQIYERLTRPAATKPPASAPAVPPQAAAAPPAQEPEPVRDGELYRLPVDGEPPGKGPVPLVTLVIFVGADEAKSAEAVRSAEALRAQLGARLRLVLKQSAEEARRLGVTELPTFFVNGRALVGMRADELRALVRKEHDRARAALRSGVAPAKLYEHLTRSGAPRAGRPVRAAARAA